MAVAGKLAVLKYKIGGVAAGGAWTDLTTVKDATLSTSASEIDVSSRANQGWKATLQGLKEGKIDFEMIWETGDAGFTAIKDAYLSSSIIGLAGLDSGGASGEGLVADFAITNFTRAEPLDGAITVSVTASVSAFSAWTTTGVA